MNPEPQLGRRERKREENRLRLLDAARAVMLRCGYERATIAEIAREADLGFGTFYGHFESKEAVFQAAVDQIGHARDGVLDAITARIDDPAERVAITCALLIELAGRYPDATRFLLEVRRKPENTGEDAITSRVRALIAEGWAAGRGDVADQEATVSATTGALLGLVHGLLGGRIDTAQATQAAAELSLRLLGVPSNEGRTLARRALARIAERLAGIEDTTTTHLEVRTA